MSRIRDVALRPIYDSRGKLTVSATIWGESGAVGSAGAPSGASTGAHEVQAFPKGGVPEALTIFRTTVRDRLLGRELNDRAGIDQALHESDGTSNFARIGGNTATAISVASALAEAEESGRALWEVVRRDGVDGRAFPAIVGNCINGGRHAIGGPDIQEFLAFSPDPEPRRSVATALAVHAAVGEALHTRWPKHALGRGDEGGWVAPVGNLEALELFAGACQTVTDQSGVPVYPGLDLASSEFYQKGRYHYREQTLDAAGQLGFLTKLIERFDLRYVEDPFHEEDFDSFSALTHSVGSRALVVGDDLFTSAVDRVTRGVERKAANAVLVKVNQVGTLSDTFATVDLTRRSGWETVTSHRSGEVPEGWLAHLAVGFGSVGFKCGLLGGERVAKLNELIRLGGATVP